MALVSVKSSINIAYFWFNIDGKKEHKQSIYSIVEKGDLYLQGRNTKRRTSI
jgi:hypothetical protein